MSMSSSSVKSNIPITKQKISSDNLFKFSPNDEYIAISNNFKLSIYSTLELKSHNALFKYQFKDIISSFDFSPFSNYILIALNERNICYIKSLNKKGNNFTNRIDEGLFGLSNAIFSPLNIDKNHLDILVFSGNSLRISIWSLDINLKNERTTISDSFLINPKFNDKRGYDFQNNLMCLAEFRNSKNSNYHDCIGVFDIKDWSVINDFQISTIDLQKIEWAHDSENIIISDSSLLCQIFIYNSHSGDCVYLMKPYEDVMDNNIINQSGIFDFKKNNNIISISCFDGSNYIYKDFHFLDSFDFCQFIIDENVTIIKEDETYGDKGENISHFKKYKAPFKIEKFKNFVNNEKDFSQQIEFSYNNKFLALVKNKDDIKNVLWVINLVELSLNTIIIFKNTINKIKWHTNSNNLYILGDGGKIYYYDADNNYLDVEKIELISSPNNIIFNKSGTIFVIGNGNYVTINPVK